MSRGRTKYSRYSSQALRCCKHVERITLLEAALRPFARFTHERDPMKRTPEEIFVPAEGDVWFYVGRADQLGRVHLHTDNFKMVRRVLGGG